MLRASKTFEAARLPSSIWTAQIAHGEEDGSTAPDAQSKGGIMPNSGPMRPRRPIDVLVQRADGWELGTMIEWRWTDEETQLWEGLVNAGHGNEWLPGNALKRVSGQRI